jgi:hypothetical protein
MTLVLGSFIVVMKVDDKRKIFYNTMRDILKIIYKCYFHLQYKKK